MSLSLIVFGTIIALLLVLLGFVLRTSARQKSPPAIPTALGEAGRTHVNFLPQMRQALKSEDQEFLARAGVSGLRGRVSRERRRVALSYVAALRQDFEEL